MLLHPAISEISSRRDRLVEAVRKGHLTPELSRYARPGWAYVLKETGVPTLAYPSTGNYYDAGEGSSVIWYVITTDDEDRDGDVVRPMGAHLKNYALNPLVFFGHQEKPIPIGVCRSDDGRLLVVLEENRALGGINFDLHDQDAAFIHDKCRRKILNATSIAFVPIEAWRRGDVRKARQHGEGQAEPGWYFNQWDMTELSIVGVPSNPKAVGLEKDLNGACRDVWDREQKEMSPQLRKAWRPYVAQAKGCWGGWCPLPGDTKDIGGGVVLKAVKKSAEPDPEMNLAADVQKAGELIWNVTVADGAVTERYTVEARSRAEAEKQAKMNFKRDHGSDGQIVSASVHKSHKSFNPDPEMDFAAQVQEAGKELENHKNPAPMPGYGQIFRGPDNQLWYVGGDGDEDGFSDLVVEKLGQLGEVTYEAEGFPPKDEGWEQLYPEQKMHSSKSVVKSGRLIQHWKLIADMVEEHDKDGIKRWLMERGLNDATASSIVNAYGSEIAGTYERDPSATATLLLEQADGALAFTSRKQKSDCPCDDCAEGKACGCGKAATSPVAEKEEDDGSWIDNPKVGDRVKTPMGNGIIQRIKVGPTLQNEVRLDDGRVVMLRTSRLEHAKAATQADLDSPGVPGRNANPSGKAEQEKAGAFLIFDRNGNRRSGTEQEFRQSLQEAGWPKELIDYAVTHREVGANYNLASERFRGEHGRPAKRARVMTQKSYRAIQETSNGHPMTTEDYDLPGPAKPIYLVVNDQGYPVNVNGQHDEDSGREGFSYWTSQSAANAVAQKLSTKKSKALPRSSAYGVRISPSGKWEVYHHARGPVAGSFNSREEAEAEALRLHERKSVKALSQSDGRVGGYTVPAEDLDDPEAPGWAACESCHGDGNCEACGGTGTFGGDDECPECGGSGECGACAGEGHREKAVRKSKREEVSQGWAIEVENNGDGTYTGYAYKKIGREWHVAGATSRYDSEDKARRGALALPRKNAKTPVVKMDAQTAESQGLEVVFSPEHRYHERIFYDRREGKYYDASTDVYLDQSQLSAYGLGSKSLNRKQLVPPAEEAAPAGPSVPQVLAALYSHAKAEAAYLDGLGEEHKDTLADYRRQQVEERMAMLKYQFSRAAGEDDDLEKMCKTFEDEHDGARVEEKGTTNKVDWNDAGRMERARLLLSAASYMDRQEAEMLAVHDWDGLPIDVRQKLEAARGIKALASTGPDSVVEPGEAGLVEQGQVPPEEQLTEKQRRKGRTVKQNQVPAEGAYTEDDADAKTELDSGAAPFNKATKSFNVGDRVMWKTEEGEKPGVINELLSSGHYEVKLDTPYHGDALVGVAESTLRRKGFSSCFNKAAPGTEEWAEEEVMEPEHKATSPGKCPDCGKPLQGGTPDDDAWCSACGWVDEMGEFSKQTPISDSSVVEEKQPGGKVCMCGMDVPEDATECPGCGAPVEKTNAPFDEEMLDKDALDNVVPEEAAPPVNKDDTAVTDPAAEEILERYQHPKTLKWSTRKHRVSKSLLPFLKFRKAANGQKYLVRSKDHGEYDIEQGTANDGPQAGKWFVTGPTGRRVAGPFSSQATAMEEAGRMGGRASSTSQHVPKGIDDLDDSEVKALTTKLAGAIDDLKALVRAKDLPRQYKAGLKHVADQIWYVGKALTDKGKEQKNGGKGSELTEAGKEQRNGGKGSELKDKGEQQGKSPTKGYAGKNRGNDFLSQPADPAVVRKFEETMAKLKRFGIPLNGSV